MRGIHHLSVLLVLTALLVVGCRRERSRVMGGEEQQEVMEGPRDYREMLERARAKQSVASVQTELEQAVARFRHTRSRLPTNLYELLSSGVLTRMPEPPPGQIYSYDPVHGNVGFIPAPDGSGIALPAEITNVAPVRLQEVPLPMMP
jgi:hypothetical protein